MYFLINKEMPLPIDNIEICVFLLTETVQKKIWNQNPQVSTVYKKTGTNQIFLYVPRNDLKGEKTLYGYTRIQVSETPIN